MMGIIRATAVVIVLTPLVLLAQATPLSVGQRVVTIDRLAVRDTAGGIKLGVQQRGALGTILTGPITVNSTAWYQVDYDAAPDGWSSGEYLAPMKFNIGDRVQTTSQLNVRSRATNKGNLLGTQLIGAVGTVIGGPTVQGGYTWWRIDYDSGVDGWSVENYLTKIGSITPPPPPPPSTKFIIGDRVEVSSGPLNVRANASASSNLLGTQPTAALGSVIGGPVSSDGFSWWQIDYDNAPDGWSSEDFLVKSTTMPPPPPPTCTENWSCTAWSSCSTSGSQTRTCTDLNSCGTTSQMPAMSQSCTPPPTPINGTCGSANGTSVTSAPTTNLCSSGTASSATGSGPWTWTCQGQNGGSNASCSASLASTGGPAGYTFCANEDATCSFSGTKSVAYGANGAFNYFTLTGGTSCTNAVFGDPIFGTVKACYTKDVACTENWSCTAFSACSTSGTQTRTCTDLNNCGTTANRPATTQSCTPTPLPSTKFSIGQQVTPTATVNVRQTASGTLLGMQSAGSLATVTGGPISAALSGVTYIWWTLDFSSGADGWVGEDNLTAYIAPPPSTNTITSNILNGATLSGAVTWIASAGGATPTKVDFYIDNVLKWTELVTVFQYNGDPSGTLDTSTLSNGSHALKLIATYSDNTTSQDSDIVTVSNSVTQPINGVCGSANGTTVSSAPATNLCFSGTTSAVSGTGPWTWTCAGSSGGTTASCSASLAVTPPPTGNSCPKGTAYADGCSSASVGAIQHSTLLSSYPVRPAWNVAGVDYAVGVPSNITLKDPTAAGVLPSCAGLSTANHLVYISSNCTLDGFDWTRGGGWNLYATGGATNVIIRNSNFGAHGLYADPSSSNVTVSHNTFDYAGDTTSSSILTISGGGYAIIEYNWMKNPAQHFVEFNGGHETVTYRYNMLEEGGQGPGSHLNYSQFQGSPFSNTKIVFNTMLQHKQVAGGEGFQLYDTATPEMMGSELGNNTMITVPSGTCNVSGDTSGCAESYMFNGGGGSGNVHDNYIDFSGAYGPFYPNQTSYTYTNNINLKTGTVIGGTTPPPPPPSPPPSGSGVAYVSDMDKIDQRMTNVDVYSGFAVSGTNPAIIVTAALNASATVSSIVLSGGLSGGTPYLCKQQRNDTTDVEIWAIPAPSGSGTLTINYTSAVDHQSNAVLLQGAHQSIPCSAADSISTIGNNITPLTVTPTNVSSSDMVVYGGAQSITGDAPHAVSGTEIFYGNSTSVNLAVGYRAGSGSVSATWGMTAPTEVLVGTRIRAYGSLSQTHSVMAQTAASEVATQSLIAALQAQLQVLLAQISQLLAQQ